MNIHFEGVEGEDHEAAAEWKVIKLNLWLIFEIIACKTVF